MHTRMHSRRSNLSNNVFVAQNDDETPVSTNPANTMSVRSITCTDLDADFSGKDHSDTM